MKRIIVVLGALSLILGFGVLDRAAATPVTVDWTARGGADSFTIAFVTFPAFTGDAVTGFTGSGAVHGHGATAPGEIDVRLNGIFTPVITFTAPATPGSLVLSSLASISFPSGAASVDAIRFATSGTGEYHSLAGEVITFNTPGVTPPTPGVPEPSMLLLLGSALIGLAAFKARFRG